MHRLSLESWNNGLYDGAAVTFKYDVLTAPLEKSVSLSIKTERFVFYASTLCAVDGQQASWRMKMCKWEWEGGFIFCRSSTIRCAPLCVFNMVHTC